MCFGQYLETGRLLAPHFTPPSVYTHFGKGAGLTFMPSVTWKQEANHSAAYIFKMHLNSSLGKDDLQKLSSQGPFCEELLQHHFCDGSDLRPLAFHTVSAHVKWYVPDCLCYLYMTNKQNKNKILGQKH